MSTPTPSLTDHLAVAAYDMAPTYAMRREPGRHAAGQVPDRAGPPREDAPQRRAASPRRIYGARTDSHPSRSTPPLPINFEREASHQA
jgi:hypothetical protein